MPAEVQLLVVVIALIGFWAIVMRPARVQQRRVAQLQTELAVGDEVIISAGIFGTVVSVDNNEVRLEIAPGTVVTVARQVVIRRAPDEAAAPASEAGSDAASEADVDPQDTHDSED